jgi:hypothetical protein
MKRARCNNLRSARAGQGARSSDLPAEVDHAMNTLVAVAAIRAAILGQAHVGRNI